MTTTMRTSESIDKIALALHGFQADITPPKKNREADTGKFKYEYADLSLLLDHCKPALQAHGLVFTSAGLTSRILHTSGQWLETDFPFDLAGMDPQRVGAVFSYARRYCFQGLLGINAEEDDDAQSTIPAAPRAAGSTQAPAKAPTPAPAPSKPVATKAPVQEPILIVEKLPPGVSRLHPENELPGGWSNVPGPGEPTANAALGMEEVVFTGYAQPKTTANGAVKMGVMMRKPSEKAGFWGDSWDPLQHDPIQKAILAGKRSGGEGVAVLVKLEREPKKDGNGDWVRIKDWQPK